MQDERAVTLDELDRLLGQQAQAIRQGDADALPALAEQLQQRLGLLARGTRGQPLPQAWRARLQALIRRAHGSQSALARRQHDVERSLAALAANLPGLQQLQAGRVYGAGGTLGATPWRSRGFERA
jgi:hypothetical protein